MNYTLPRSLLVGGRDMEIRWDFRAALDILAALGDPELDARDRGLVALYVFYPGFEDMEPGDYEEALERLEWFLNGGQEEQKGGGSARLMDWEQDFPLIVAPVNRVLGRDIRGDAQLHWWTFLAAYMEIGDCTFAQAVAIRDKQSRGQKLDKYEREWYRRNKNLVDLKRKYTRAEMELISKLI